MGQPGQQHEGTDGSTKVNNMRELMGQPWVNQVNNMRELMGQPGQQHEGSDGSTRSTT